MTLFHINAWLKRYSCVLTTILILLVLCIGIPIVLARQDAIVESNYQSAMAVAATFVENEQYEDALDVLDNIRFKYEPAKTYYNDVSELHDLHEHYSDGVTYMEQGYYIQAIHEFARCITYKDASDLIDQCITLAIEVN